MDDYKKNVKAWLKKEGKTRFWLAEQCQVDKRTVDKWFEKSSNIPSSRVIIINSLIAKSEEINKEIDQIECHFSIRISNEDFEKYSKQALEMGMTVSEYALYAMERIIGSKITQHPFIKSLKSEGGSLPTIYGTRPKGDIA